MKKIGIITCVMAAALSHAFAQPNVSFKKHTLTNVFLSEGVAVGDVDHDGKLDVMAGAAWFKAPNWERYDIDAPKTYNIGKEHSFSFLNYALDVNRDGWVDLVVVGYPGTPAIWFENPKNKPGHWPKHEVMPGVGVGNESPNFVDMDGDGRLDLLCADVKAKQIVWLSAPTRKGDTTWTRYPISAPNAPATDRYSHGLGHGDINGDSRADVICTAGWWEAPADVKQPNWIFHMADLGGQRSHMYAHDLNGDGLNDVISASAHNYGIWWYEQWQHPLGGVLWVRHQISKVFSQTHAVAFADVNGDGVPDIITGKRLFAHNDTNIDPGTHEPSVIYWFEVKQGKPPQFIPHEIDAASGVGLNIEVVDMNKDKAPDIVISNKNGVFYFENLMKATRKR